MTKDIQIPPPTARKAPRTIELHGEKLEDDYGWLRDKEHGEVQEYLEAENAYADAQMAHTAGFQQKLYDELLSHIKETDEGVPYRYGHYFYYARTEQGKQYPIYCRKHLTLDAAEGVILDQNLIAVGEKFMAIGAFEMSPDGSLLAYSTDNTGFRQYTLYVKDLLTGELAQERIEKTGSVEWAADSRTLFYTVEDETKRHYRLYRHVLGADAANDALILQEDDEAFSIGVGKTRSGRFLVMGIGSHTTSESRFLAADDPTGEWRMVAPRVQDQEYDLDHHGDRFYIRTNRDGRNFHVVTAPVADPRRENWKDLIPHRDDVMVEGVDLFADHLVVTERVKGLESMRIRDLRPGAESKEHSIDFPEPAYVAYGGANREFETQVFRLVYQSPITPASTYDYDMESRELKLMKQTEVPGGFAREKYSVERLWATAKDGVRVPVTVVYRNDKRNGPAPTYLYGYGSYGIPLPPAFSSNRLALLDRGVLIALAHIRGGGDLGKPWHDQGRMKNKLNSFTDFITVAEFLIEKEYAQAENIVAEGGSAGGLLMGAVSNLRSDLWRAIVSKVPFVDVMNTMMDASLPLTVGEYEEWGDPNEPEYFRYMRSYSPYDNLTAQAYPAMLVKTSFHDSQVMYWEPAKYVAKLRTLKTDDRPLLLKTNMAAGHGGASGRYDFLREVAFDYAFILWQLGLAE